jgi:hypothetical protein
VTKKEFSLFPSSARTIRKTNVSAAGNDSCLTYVLIAGSARHGSTEMFRVTLFFGAVSLGASPIPAPAVPSREPGSKTAHVDLPDELPTGIQPFFSLGRE